MTRGHPWFMLPNVVGLLLCDMVGPVGLHGACDPLHGAVMAAHDMHAPLMPATCECVRLPGTPCRISLGRSVSATPDCPLHCCPGSRPRRITHPARPLLLVPCGLCTLIGMQAMGQRRRGRGWLCNHRATGLPRPGGPAGGIVPQAGNNRGSQQRVKRYEQSGATFSGGQLRCGGCPTGRGPWGL